MHPNPKDNKTHPPADHPHPLTPAPNPPRLAFWETTQACNLACIHCRRALPAPAAHPDELSTAQATDMIDQLAAAGCAILVCSGGEPLMRPDLFTLLNHARNKQLHTAVASNGTQLDDAVAHKLALAGARTVSISLDGPTAPAHDGFRGVQGSFDAAIRAVHALRQAQVAVQINTTVTTHNHLCLQEIYDLAQRLDAEALHFFMLVPVGCGLQLAKDMMLSPHRYEQILNWIYDKELSSDRPRIKATCAPHYLRIRLQRRQSTPALQPTAPHTLYRMARGCLAGTDIVFISHAGQVFPCGYLPIPAGDLRAQPFHEIWRDSPILNTFRGTITVHGKCGRCQYLQICLGCRARAYAATGDLLAEEPCCAFQPPTPNRGDTPNG